MAAIEAKLGRLWGIPSPHGSPATWSGTSHGSGGTPWLGGLRLSLGPLGCYGTGGEARGDGVSEGSFREMAAPDSAVGVIYGLCSCVDKLVHRVHLVEGIMRSCGPH